eukprot:gnl/Trimastix_PCT/3538.p1 GENE.gnl/Trimastix_PCT/3538~~gnl/Trimastix_PCT/3538.p1  ORF type:complete len:417 (+),score=58.21 gnl/Trimastix_PCT/3538:47-1297(+)
MEGSLAPPQQFTPPRTGIELLSSASLCSCNLSVSLLLWISFLSWPLFLILWQVLHNQLFMILFIVCISLFALSFAFYIIESFCISRVRHYVENLRVGEKNACHFLEKMHRDPPMFIFHVECYHYEKRTRTRTVRDSKGRTRTVRETYTVKVVTHRATGSHTFRYWHDYSGDLTALHHITKSVAIDISKDFVFGDDGAKAELESAFSMFRAANRRDVHQSYSKEYTFEHHVPGVLLWRGDKRPTCLTQHCYCALTFFLMAFPMRCYLWARCARARHVVRKVAFSTPRPPSMAATEQLTSETLAPPPAFAAMPLGVIEAATPYQPPELTKLGPSEPRLEEPPMMAMPADPYSGMPMPAMGGYAGVPASGGVIIPPPIVMTQPPAPMECMPVPGLVPGSVPVSVPVCESKEEKKEVVHL